MTGSLAQHDIGPALPSRQAVYFKAREVGELARIAAELSTAGPRCDVGRAIKKLEQAKALLIGGGE